MLKKIFCTLFVSSLITVSAFSAGSSSNNSNETNYDKAVSHINLAKKYEVKGKTKKANQKYEKALQLLLKSNIKSPNNADTLNYLGFTSRKLGNFSLGEKYYLLGLTIDPDHKGINEYLGELYVATDRMDLAKERLEVLKNCNCEEYADLKEVIEGKKKSKY